MEIYNSPQVAGYAPTFHPTEEEFANFSAYIRKIEPQVLPYGICKVVPPKNWRATSPQTYASLAKHIPTVRKPMRQTAKPTNDGDKSLAGVYDVHLTWLGDMELEEFQESAEALRRVKKGISNSAPLQQLVSSLMIVCLRVYILDDQKLKIVLNIKNYNFNSLFEVVEK